jgi:hypothetical protein
MLTTAVFGPDRCRGTVPAVVSDDHLRAGRRPDRNDRSSAWPTVRLAYSRPWSTAMEADAALLVAVVRRDDGNRNAATFADLVSVLESPLADGLITLTASAARGCGRTSSCDTVDSLRTWNTYGCGEIRIQCPAKASAVLIRQVDRVVDSVERKLHRTVSFAAVEVVGEQCNHLLSH